MDVLSFKVALVGYLIDCDPWMQVNSQLNLILVVTLEKFVVTIFISRLYE